MSILDAIWLGILQGLTEFLPVSSSGHLAVAEYLLGYNPEKELLFKLVVHLGTLLAVLWVYKDSLLTYVRDAFGLLKPREDMGFFQRLTTEQSAREVTFLLLATIPTGVIGVLFNKPIKAAFSSLTIVGLMFAITGFLLISTRFLKTPSLTIADLGWWRAILVGVAQGFAILPGISRSGTTIVIALMLGLRRDESARYSFLLAIPAIAGALVLEGRKVNFDAIVWEPLVIGLVASLIMGYLALRWLILLVKQGQLQWFAPYMWIAASVTLLLSMQGNKPAKAGHKATTPTVRKADVRKSPPLRAADTRRRPTQAKPVKKRASIK